MSSVILATCTALPDGDEDAALLGAALGRRGLDGRWAAWNDPGVDWAESLVVVRSTWDYTAGAGGLPRLDARCPRTWPIRPR